VGIENDGEKKDRKKKKNIASIMINHNPSRLPSPSRSNFKKKKKRVEQRGRLKKYRR
jgi:hypothetical protein